MLKKLPTVVAHADWSTSSAKRWCCTAIRDDGGFVCDSPRLVGSLPAYFDHLLALAVEEGNVLAGFDFPIGLPKIYGRIAGLTGFVPALQQFGQPPWEDFFEIATIAAEINIHRPFYPARPGGTRRLHLLNSLGVSRIEELMRECERATAYRGDACSLFWTLGGNQVGRASISGWKDLLAPALVKYNGTMGIWPFDGLVEPLLGSRRLVVVETYPADVYRRLGFPRRGWSKRKQVDRQERGRELIDWLAGVAQHTTTTQALNAEIIGGFGLAASGEDRFDAMVGLFGMLEVLMGQRPEGVPDTASARMLEGWIFGQCSGSF